MSQQRDLMSIVDGASGACRQQREQPALAVNVGEMETQPLTQLQAQNVRGRLGTAK